MWMGNGPMTPLEKTLAAMKAHGTRVIFLNGKNPLSRGGHHWTSSDPDEIRRHRGNLGLMAGPFAVLDFDLVGIESQMFSELGPLVPTVQTGSGKIHCHVQWIPNLPRNFHWHGQKVGEIARLPTEYTVCPPSMHPETKQPYVWIADPWEPFPALPEAWQFYLVRPSYIPNRDLPSEPWDGPPPAELIRRAMRQPGASRRATGVKFQCPGCRADGHDKHMDNAWLRNDGRWGCAVDQTGAHRRAIAEALGVKIPAMDLPGDDVSMWRALDLSAERTLK